ncbi:hypothetical protein ACI6NS_004802 [Escherichia coli]
MAYYSAGGRARSFNIDTTVVTIAGEPDGTWRTKHINIEGSLLNRITVMSDRSLTMNLGDEELHIPAGVEVDIPPPRRDGKYRSKLKTFLHGRVVGYGTTTYNVRYNTTYL